MSRQHELNSYIERLQRRLRLGYFLRGIAVLTGTALVSTILLVLLLNAFAFPHQGVIGARIALVGMLAVAAAIGLAVPLLRLSRRRSVAAAEASHPDFQQRLVTFEERQGNGADPFLELLATDTLAVAADASPDNIVPGNLLYVLAGAGFGCLVALVLLISTGPGYLGYGASLLWIGPKHNAPPLYDIRITPGDIAVRRNSDQLITAQVIGLHADKVKLFARYQSSLKKFGKDGGWEPVAMQPEADLGGGSNFKFLFTGLPEDVEYYVEAGPVTSRHFKVRVVDLPSVKQIHVTYHYPKWTEMQPVTDDQGGDLRAIEGTDAEITVQMDKPLRDGMLVMDNGQPLHLAGGDDNSYKAQIHMENDGAYHVAAVDEGQTVRLSEDYFISTNKANPPEIAIVRPAQDYHASPIEEVTIGVKAADDFALNHVSLHYSVNGGPDKSVNLLTHPGEKNAAGTTTLDLEDYKLVPGDVISLYATAADGHAEARTDISFIQADPFEREFSQSQQSGGGGGGGGQGQNNQTDISKREKELIAETWKHQNDKTATTKESADAGKFLSDVQAKLRQQVLALSARLESRDLSTANEEFTSFQKDMLQAANAMTPSADKLKGMHWQEAIPIEQKALQYLLRADATFRQIQLAFGQRGGGGGGGGSAGRDLASMFDLELDTEKNAYETAQTGSAEEERQKAVDDALQKLDALAHRQDELAQQQHASPTFQERWQQEMLRREAEQLQRQMEGMAQKQNGQGQQSDGQQSEQQNTQSLLAQTSSLGQTGSKASSGSQSATNSQTKGDETDPRVQQALNRLREANETLKRSTGPQANSEAARRAADQLQQATNLLGGAENEQIKGNLASLAGETERLSHEEKSQADQIQGLKAEINADGQLAPPTQEQYEKRLKQREQLAQERQSLSDDLSQLERRIRNSARELAPTQPGASTKLRDALSGMDQNDLDNLVQRTADWLRRGIDPNSNGTEGNISSGLQHLSEQMRQAQQEFGTGAQGQNSTGKQDSEEQQIAALDHLQRLRRQVQSQMQSGQQAGGKSGYAATQDGKNQPGGKGQGEQNGAGTQGQNGALNQGQGARQNPQGNSGNQQGGNGQGLNRGGDIGDNNSGHGGQGAAWGDVNTAKNHFGTRGRDVATPNGSASPEGSERAYQNGMTELNQLHHLAQNDPAAQKEVQELIREMQQLDPHRFTGNPAMVEQLHTQMLTDVDKLELQLRHDMDDSAKGEVRTGKAAAVPAGYQDAVADYYRRLSSSGK